jgi:hypothetical protein
MNRLKYILLLRVVIVILSLLAVHNATAQQTVYVGQTSSLGVVQQPGNTYLWELYDSVDGINLATTPGNCPLTKANFVNGINDSNEVVVQWNVAGTYFYKVTAIDTCANNIKVGKMTVLPTGADVSMSLAPASICVGDTSILTLTFTGTQPFTFKLQIDDGATQIEQIYSNITTNTYTIDLNPTTTTTYTVLEITDANGTNLNPASAVTLTVQPNPTNSPIYKYTP